jgi:uncharacterized protein (TIGR00725 family)
MTDPRRPLRVSVVGAGNATEEESSLAESLGKALALRGAVVVTGGLGGVMAAASRGCHEAGGTTVGILPGGDPSVANPWVQIPIPTGLGEARNAMVAGAGEAMVAIGGSWGTLSEIALARKMGRPVILLASPMARLPLPGLSDPVEAAERALTEASESRETGVGKGT